MRRASRRARSSLSRPRIVTAPGRSPTAILMPKRGCFARSKSVAGSGRSRTRRARNGLLVVQVGAFELVLGTAEGQGQGRRRMDRGAQFPGAQEYEDDEAWRSRFLLSLGRKQGD